MIRYGIDNIKQHEKLFCGKRLGLITSVSGMDSSLRSTISIFQETYGLTALFGPEHGVRGDRDAGELVDGYVDEITQLPVYSLYRQDGKRFTEQMLDKVDAVVYDIQDVGARFYTFITTMLYAMEDCARFGKELIVLDRPNPLGGTMEGNILDKDYFSFVGSCEIPVRYGLTAGELAVMLNTERRIGCRLTVVPCTGWKRSMLFPETNKVWVMPSLGLPRFETALLYPGMCIFEGTNISEGRGTACPFEIIGAPFIPAQKLTDYMNEQKLPGVLFSPVYFKPTASKHQGVFCKGIHTHITDIHQYQPVRTGLVLLEAIREMCPEFSFLPAPREGGRRFIELLGGHDLLEAKKSVDQMLHENEEGCARFAEKAEPYYLYSE